MTTPAQPPREPYVPPRQSVRGQLLDAATVLVLIFATLFATTYLTSDDGTEDGASAAPVQQVDQLPVTPGEKIQYQKMIDTGTADLPTVAAGVAANQPSEDKYPIAVWPLLGTVVLLAVYLAFVYRTSLREYRDVIEERFGPRCDSGPREESR